MERNSSKYEDAQSKGSNSDLYINNNNIYMNYSNQKYTNQRKENKRYNNMPEINIIMKNTDNIDNINNIYNNNSKMNSLYSSPRQNETIFETEKKISYCSTCTCNIF